MVYYWSTIVHTSLYPVSCVDFVLTSRQSGAHHKADETQVGKDVYDEYHRVRKAQRSNDKRRVVLAASALASAAGEPASEYEGSPMTARALVVAAARCAGARPRAAEAAEGAARSLAAGRPRMEIAELLQGALDSRRGRRAPARPAREISARPCP